MCRFRDFPLRPKSGACENRSLNSYGLRSSRLRRWSSLPWPVDGRAGAPRLRHKSAPCTGTASTALRHPCLRARRRGGTSLSLPCAAYPGGKSSVKYPWGVICCWFFLSLCSWGLRRLSSFVSGARGFVAPKTTHT